MILFISTEAIAFLKTLFPQMNKFELFKDIETVVKKVSKQENIHILTLILE